MKENGLSESEIRILALLRLDAQRLYERIKFRAPEYLTIYSTKRTREHFAAIFKNRYDDVSIEDLKNCNEETIYALDAFYTTVDKLRWYLYTTEDMPNTVDTEVHKCLAELRREFEQLVETIDVQRGYQSGPVVDTYMESVNQVSFGDADPGENLDDIEIPSIDNLDGPPKE